MVVGGFAPAGLNDNNNNYDNDNKDLIQQYTISESDLSIIRQHRGAANRMGFAIQLCYMRYPGIILSINEKPFPPLLNVVADQLKMSANV